VWLCVCVPKAHWEGAAWQSFLLPLASSFISVGCCSDSGSWCEANIVSAVTKNPRAAVQWRFTIKFYCAHPRDTRHEHVSATHKTIIRMHTYKGSPSHTNTLQRFRCALVVPKEVCLPLTASLQHVVQLLACEWLLQQASKAALLVANDIHGTNAPCHG